MYEEFYGLSRRPFENTPNPEFFFASKQHREGLAALIYGIKQSKGFMLVTGEVGSGKTFLIQSLKYELEEENHIILEVATPWITPEELFAELPEKLGMDMDAEWGSLVFQAKLKEELERLHEQGRRVLVILDEAQQLPERTLEGIRLLSNFENEDAKLIQIIFLGQNELNDILGRYSMRQIRQRITLSRSLGYFNEIETRRYIEHRLAVSGCDKPIFDDDALSLIFRTSHGSPRLINLICDNCLITGYAHFSRQIDASIVREVLADLPPVHQENMSNHEPAADEQPLQVIQSEPLKAPLPERAPTDVSKPRPTPVFTNPVDEPQPVPVKPRAEPVPTPVAATVSGTSPFAAENEYDSFAEDEYRPHKQERPGIFRRYGLWMVLVATVVVSWYAARWYETRERDEVAIRNTTTSTAAEPTVSSSPQVTPLAAQPETAKRELTWDDDPVIASVDGNPVAETVSQPVEVVQPIETSSVVETSLTVPADTADQEPVAEVLVQHTQSALERYSVGTKGDDGLSLFERLRREANVADVRSTPYDTEPEPVSQPAVVTENVEPKTAVETKVTLSTESDAVDTARAVTEVPYKPVETVAKTDDGRALIGVPEGVVTSTKRAKRYESGSAIPYPFENLASQLKQPVPFTAGETISEMARAKYSTWNDTVQDMVRTVNPSIRNLNRVYAKAVNLPDVSRENLLVNDESRGWFAYAGTVTSRLKANHLYESFVALGEPADMEVTNNGERRIYRVFIGPYDSREAALLKLGNINFTHMPYLK